MRPAGGASGDAAEQSQSPMLALLREAGATSVEYAIMAALIAAVVIGSVTLVGIVTRDNYCGVTDEWGSVDSTVASADECDD